MNILIMEDSSKVGFGGGQKVTLQASNVLLKHHVLLFSDFCNDSIFQQKLKNNLSVNDMLLLKNYSYRKSNSFFGKIGNYIGKIICIIPNMYRLIRFIRLHNIEYVYCTTRMNLIYAYFIKLILRTPYIYHAHLVNRRTSLLSGIWNLLIMQSDCVFCVSKAVKESINHKKSILLYNPSLNRKGYKGEKHDTNFIVAAIGSLIPIKGFNYFIEAARKMPEYEFRIYGMGQLYDSFSHGTPSNLKLMGFCDDILREMYESIDLVVVPTIIEEALPLVIVESQSVGLPVICTNIGGQAEIVNDCYNGFQVPVENSDAIFKAIKKITSDLELYNQLSRNSFISSSKFSYDIFSNLLIESFKIATNQ